MSALSAEEWLARLVSFDTTSRQSNLALISAIQGFLSDRGISARLTSNAEGTKANLFATIGPGISGGIVLSGHTDVVPVDGQNWLTPPFELTERGGLLYGRGSADMKGFIACVLAEVPRLCGLSLKKPIHLAFSFDEEVGCLGVHHLVKDVVSNLPLPAAVIVGEPTGMKVVNAQKGVVVWRTTVLGHEAHSSSTHAGVNAVAYAAELVSFLSRLAEEVKTPERCSERFDPPYTTIHVGTIHGGTAQNIVPRECQFTWEIRFPPRVDYQPLKDAFDGEVARLLAVMKRTSQSSAIVTNQIAFVPALTDIEGSPAEALALAITGQNASLAVSYGTEAGIFQTHDMPAVICGPGHMSEAHKPNEFIAVSQLRECSSFLQRLGLRMTQSERL